MFRRHPVIATLSVGYLGVVAWVTLGPQPLDVAGQRMLWRILSVLSDHDLTAWITYSRVEFLANVAMFIPIGMFFLLLFGRKQWWLSMLLGVVLTVGIEVAQLSIAGRVSDPRDVLANSLGAVMGVLAALLLTAPAARRLRQAAARRKRGLTTGEIAIPR